MIIAILVVVVLLVGGGLTFFLLNQGDDPSGTASQAPTTDQQDPAEGGTEADLAAVGQAYADAINAEDVAAATELTCQGSSPGAVYEGAAGGNSEISLGEVNITGADYGTVGIIIGSQPDLPMPMSFQDGSWCVSM